MTEKIDGRLAVLYRYRGQWHVCSEEYPDGSDILMVRHTENSFQYFSAKPLYNPWKFFGDDFVSKPQSYCEVPNALVRIENEEGKKEDGKNHKHKHNGNNKKIHTIVFNRLFWRCWAHSFMKLPYVSNIDNHDDKVYMFELQDSRHFLVLSNKDKGDSKLILHGVRDMTTLSELNPFELASFYKWNVAKQFTFNETNNNNVQIDQKFVLEKLTTLNPLECSGFVVTDMKTMERLKFKQPQHAALRKLLWSDDEQRNQRMLLEFIRTNPNQIEFLEIFPQFQKAYETAKIEYEKLISLILKEYNQVKEIAGDDVQLFSAKSASIAFRVCLFHLRNSAISDPKCSLKVELEKFLSVSMPFGRFENLSKQVFAHNDSSKKIGKEEMKNEKEEKKNGKKEEKK